MDRHRLGRNGERDFHGEKRSNETHASTTEPEAVSGTVEREAATAMIVRHSPGAQAHCGATNKVGVERQTG